MNTILSLIQSHIQAYVGERVSVVTLAENDDQYLPTASLIYYSTLVEADQFAKMDLNKFAEKAMDKLEIKKLQGDIEDGQGPSVITDVQVKVDPWESEAIDDHPAYSVLITVAYQRAYHSLRSELEVA